MKKFSVTLIAIILLLLCSAQVPIPEVPYTEALYVPMTTKRAILYTTPHDVTGRLVYPNYSPVTADNLAVRLAWVFYCNPYTRDCYFILSGGTSPADGVDEDGNFEFYDVPAAWYVILIHDLLTDTFWLVSSENGQVMFPVFADIDVGTIIFDPTKVKVDPEASYVESEYPQCIGNVPREGGLPTDC